MTRAQAKQAALKSINKGLARFAEKFRSSSGSLNGYAVVHPVVAVGFNTTGSLYGYNVIPRW